MRDAYLAEASATGQCYAQWAIFERHLYRASLSLPPNCLIRENVQRIFSWLTDSRLLRWTRWESLTRMVRFNFIVHSSVLWQFNNRQQILTEQNSNWSFQQTDTNRYLLTNQHHGGLQSLSPRRLHFLREDSFRVFQFETFKVDTFFKRLLSSV